MPIVYTLVVIAVIYAIRSRRKSEPKEYNNVENHEI